MVFEPYFITILKQNDGRVAFEYANKKPKANQLIISHETFEILSIFTKLNSNDEE